MIYEGYLRIILEIAPFDGPTLYTKGFVDPNNCIAFLQELLEYFETTLQTSHCLRFPDMEREGDLIVATPPRITVAELRESLKRVETLNAFLNESAYQVFGIIDCEFRWFCRPMWYCASDMEKDEPEYSVELFFSASIWEEFGEGFQQMPFFSEFEEQDLESEPWNQPDVETAWDRGVLGLVRRMFRWVVGEPNHIATRPFSRREAEARFDKTEEAVGGDR